MSPIEMAMFLSAIVVTVLVATRPTPTRRRPAPAASTRSNQSGATNRGSRANALIRRGRLADLTPDPMQRNHWDRNDMAAGVGRDHAHPDVTLTVWP